MRAPLLPALALFVLLPAVVPAQTAPTFTVQPGQYPWHDRAGQWAFSQLPEKYVSDQPLPQQSCTARTLVLPTEGLKEVLMGGLEKEAAAFLAKSPSLKDTGDRLEIKSGGTTLRYAIFTYANPPRETSFAFSSAGVILLSLGAGASEPTNRITPAPATPAAPKPGEYVPADKAAPWHDRVGRWEIAGLPAAYRDGPPVPQQSCDAKTLVVAEGTKAVTVGLSDSDVAEFQKRYPAIKDTGLDLTIQPPGGGAGLPYSIFVFPNPPAKGDFREFAKGGLVLLRLDDSTGAATPAPTGGTKAVLSPEQEISAQEWPFTPGERKVKFHVEEPPAGINAGTGFMLVLHNWGGVYDSPEYLKWSKTFAARYNVVAISVNYLQSGPGGWGPGKPYDHGYLQAMDCLRALYAVWKQLKDKGVAVNEHRVYSMGGSGGGNVTEMVMKLAPHTFACGVDICGMPGLLDSIAFGTGEGTSLNAGYSKDPASPAFLSPDMQEIRDFGNYEHCKLLHAANPNLKVVIVHGVTDASCPVVPKIGQFQQMVRAGLDVDGHFLTDFDVDGRAVTNTGHPVGDREQVVVKYADEYLKSDGKFARATAGPSDFTRGGTFEYPTTNGKYVVDFTAEPTISFVKR